MARLVAFGYCGGKFYQLNWLKRLLPECHHFIEPYCGSAIVTLNREPSKLETINDTNGEIINFFRVLRDYGDKLIEKLENTAFSRQEYVDALELVDAPIERARRFYVLARQSFGGKIGGKLAEGSWGYTVEALTHGSIPTTRWINPVGRLNLIRDRLRPVQIENRPALDVIKRFDRESTLFYCDPPYVQTTHNVDSYGNNDMTNEDHQQLAEVLHNCKAKVAISGHCCDLYDELYHDWDCHEKDGNYKRIDNLQGQPKKRRSELLWTNYEVTNAN